MLGTAKIFNSRSQADKTCDWLNEDDDDGWKYFVHGMKDGGYSIAIYDNGSFIRYWR
jgi:hypothetical protein